MSASHSNLGSARSRAKQGIGPGRPKDLGKRAAILDAAKAMFTRHGFDGTSMDQIATEAGVSKLTVYSHFGDKEALFGAAVRAHCEQQLPSSVFEQDPDAPLRQRLIDVARAFYSMLTTPESLAGYRMLCTPQLVGSPLSHLFWEGGPARVQKAFAALLERRIQIGQLQIDDVPRAAAQFFALLKGEPHAMAVFGCCQLGPELVERHIAASVDLFLQGYATRPEADRA
ncbi:MAG: TetR/AcrR family transcriptional regulator [Lysobacter sp.]|nr:TetR/AcrR family transcriptional regulator [Lysobacter sp.]